MQPRKRDRSRCNGPRTWDVQPTLEDVSAAHATAQAAEWLVAGSPLPQALIQFCQRLINEPRLGTLVILLRQQLGGGPPAAAERPTSRHILDRKVAPRKE